MKSPSKTNERTPLRVVGSADGGETPFVTREEFDQANRTLMRVLDELREEVAALRDDLRRKKTKAAKPRRPTQDTADLLYGVPSIAAYLGMTEKQVYHLTAARHVPTFRIGRRVCARVCDLDTWLASKSEAGRAAR